MCDTEWYEYKARVARLAATIATDPDCAALLLDGWSAEELAESILQHRLPRHVR